MLRIARKVAGDATAVCTWWDTGKEDSNRSNEDKSANKERPNADAGNSEIGGGFLIVQDEPSTAAVFAGPLLQSGNGLQIACVEYSATVRFVCPLSQALLHSLSPPPCIGQNEIFLLDAVSYTFMDDLMHIALLTSDSSLCLVHGFAWFALYISSSSRDYCVNSLSTLHIRRVLLM